jgi:hypothetical protein
MVLQHTLAPGSSGAGQSCQNVPFIDPSKVPEQDGSTNADLRLVNVCQVVVAQSLGLRPSKGRRSEWNSSNFPFPLPMFNNILANEDGPLISTPFGRGFLISSASYFFKAASLRR